MDVLNEREKHILSERRLKEEPATLEELSKVYGISRERVRQIESKAVQKLQQPFRCKTLSSFIELPNPVPDTGLSTT